MKNALAGILAGGQRTAPFVAHRLSTIRNCDRIPVINQARDPGPNLCEVSSCVCTVWRILQRGFRALRGFSLL
jgi:hypothetical protein